MRTITLIEPWATLITIGAKCFETRSWPAGFTGPVAIHAGKNETFIEEAFTCDPVAGALREHNVAEFHLGHVIAVAWLNSCRPTEIVRPMIDDFERAYGDYADGRWAWELTHVLRFARPVPARGFQKVWDWQAEDDALREQIREWRFAIEREAVRA